MKQTTIRISIHNHIKGSRPEDNNSRMNYWIIAIREAMNKAPSECMLIFSGLQR